MGPEALVAEPVQVCGEEEEQQINCNLPSGLLSQRYISAAGRRLIVSDQQDRIQRAVS